MQINNWKYVDFKHTLTGLSYHMGHSKFHMNLNVKMFLFFFYLPQWVSQVKWYSSPPLFQPALHPQTLLPILLFCLSEHALHLYAVCCMQITCSDLSHKSCSSFACALVFSCRVRTKKKNLKEKDLQFFKKLPFKVCVWYLYWSWHF